MYASQATWQEGYRAALADLIAKSGMAPNSTKGGAKGFRDDWQVGHSLWHRDLLLYGRAGCSSSADAWQQAEPPAAGPAAAPAAVAQGRG